MAKKKREYNTKENKYKIELIGILLILLAIIGIFKSTFGFVGDVISTIAVLFVGKAYSFLLIAVFLTGAYMIIRREKPKYFNSKLVGIYIITIGVLTLVHAYYISDLKIMTSQIFNATFENLKQFFEGTDSIRGGGMVGASFTTLFIKLFTVSGTKIVCIILISGGFLILTGLSIYDIFKKSKDKFGEVIKYKDYIKDKEEITKVEDDYENDKKVVSSVNELIHNSEEKDILKEYKEPTRNAIEYVENKGYLFPPITLLGYPPKKSTKDNQFLIKENVSTLEKVFADFEIEGKVVAINIGPAVTQYEMEVRAGTKVSKVLGINREVALALAAKDVRIQAPIPGKKTVGVEIPNKDIAIVTIREVLETIPKNMEESKLLVVLGKNIMGKPIYCELNKTPHLLVAGATGSGKSVCINSMIISILMRTRPDEVKLVLIDPKKVELSMYNGAPHLLSPVVTDPRKASIVLKKIVVEMERRYDLFEESGTKNIAGYNALIEKKNKNIDEAGQMKKIPYIVVIIDELADLMLVAAKEVEDSIMRITQIARAAGIHLVVATQRPSTDVITGLIKANIPSRISFAVSSSIDSRTILDMMGAEKLLGRGDMLFIPQGENTPLRVQGTFVSDEEIKEVVDYTISQQKARYDETLAMDDEEMHATSMVEGDDYEEPFYHDIVEFVVTQGKASASLLQRRFRFGYNRAARCMDLLEDRGIVGPANGSKPREVLVKLENKN